MIPNSELRARARQNLGNSIFHNNWLTALAMCLVGSVIANFFPLILMGPVSFGLSVAFLKKARGSEKFDFNDLFLGFDRFGETLVLGLMQALIPFLWGLIPIVGIIFSIRKSFSYALAFYVKVDYPDTDWRGLLMLMAPVLGALVYVAAAIAFIVVSIMRFVSLYRTAKLFRLSSTES